MKLFRSLGCFFLSLSLGACVSNEGGDQDPTIGEVQTNIIHYHPSYTAKWPDEIQRTLDYTFALQANDPQGLGDILHLWAVDTFTALGEYHAIVGGSVQFYPVEVWYQADFQGFERRVYNLFSLDRVNLQTWHIESIDHDGNNTQRSFEFTLPDGEPAQNEQYVYSSSYENPTENGVAALEAMTIAGNGLSIIADEVSESYTIEFTVSDDRAKNYALWFYDNAESPVEIGVVDQLSLSIASSPIVFGEKTTLQLPWSEIPLKDGYAREDIFGVHVVLLDQPVAFKFLANELWSTYYGVSEYLVLP